MQITPFMPVGDLEQALAAEMRLIGAGAPAESPQIARASAASARSASAQSATSRSTVCRTPQ